MIDPKLSPLLCSIPFALCNLPTEAVGAAGLQTSDVIKTMN